MTTTTIRTFSFPFCKFYAESFYGFDITSSLKGYLIIKNDGLLFVRIYGERHENHWALVSLDFGLAAQGTTLDDAFKRLDQQIRDYIYDATVGEDKEFGDDLLNRKAPAEFFFKYYLATFRQAIRSHLQNVITCSQPFQVVA